MRRIDSAQLERVVASCFRELQWGTGDMMRVGQSSFPAVAHHREEKLENLTNTKKSRPISSAKLGEFPKGRGTWSVLIASHPSESGSLSRFCGRWAAKCCSAVGIGRCLRRGF